MRDVFAGSAPVTDSVVCSVWCSDLVLSYRVSGGRYPVDFVVDAAVAGADATSEGDSA